jgi:hypothetical protein
MATQGQFSRSSPIDIPSRRHSFAVPEYPPVVRDGFEPVPPLQPFDVFAPEQPTQWEVEEGVGAQGSASTQNS